ncbi:MAG: type II secretion system F family protein [Huintestinicola sp.]|uniref:type II secretion system F family protein n=1 Tax=Huintestinicola sp. TaxID=2981661 RepID=UPI003F0515C7
MGKKSSKDIVIEKKSGDINYNKCPMKPYEHLAVFAAFTVVGTAVLYVFYHNVFIALPAAFIAAFFLESSYANSRIKARRKKLRVQFCDMLESMAVASRAGNTELHALESALKDLKLTYSEDTDIVVEVTNILSKYRNGIQLRVLFKDFGERSGVDDILSFAQIFEVIEGKSNKFSDIIKQTQQVISDKIEIEQEIETVLTAPKQETVMMLIMPVLLMLLFSSDGDGGMMGMLFTTLLGRVLTTVCVIIFIASFFLAQKLTDIKV